MEKLTSTIPEQPDFDPQAVFHTAYGPALDACMALIGGKITALSEKVLALEPISAQEQFLVSYFSVLKQDIYDNVNSPEEHERIDKLISTALEHSSIGSPQSRIRFAGISMATSVCIRKIDEKIDSLNKKVLGGEELSPGEQFVLPNLDKLKIEILDVIKLAGAFRAVGINETAPR